MVCAKLVIGPFGRIFPSPALLIGTPPPKAQLDPLVAMYWKRQQVTALDTPLLERPPYASFPQVVFDLMCFGFVMAAGLGIRVVSEVQQLWVKSSA